jgi:hypothetical protein
VRVGAARYSTRLAPRFRSDPRAAPLVSRIAVRAPRPEIRA